MTDYAPTNLPKKQAVTFFGKMLTFSRIHLETNDLTIIEAQLAKLLNKKDSLIPVIIDSQVEQNLSALLQLLWDWGLQPIGVVTGLLDEQAQQIKLAIFPQDGKRIERIKVAKAPQPTADTQKTEPTPNQPEQHTPQTDSTPQTQEPPQTLEKTETTAQSTPADQTNEPAKQTDQNPKTEQPDQNPPSTPETELEQNIQITPPQTQTEIADPNDLIQDNFEPERITSLIYDQMLRSGQSLNHVGGDLIVTSSVNNGAEAITDNTLHIYGKGQGRLVAGATGDKDARIFCQKFNPSLVSVAGTYCLRDNIPEEVIDQPVQVRYIEGQGLVFTIMGDN